MRQRLETLRYEAESTIQVLYALKHYAVLRGSETHVKKMNQNAQFWLLFESALLSKLFIGIRRLFENDSDTQNFHRIFSDLKKSIGEFQPEALERRKIMGKSERPLWLDEYMSQVYRPTADDFNALARMVRPHRKRMTGVYTTVASKVFAHAVHTDTTEINNLLRGTSFEEIEAALNVIWHFYEQVWQMYENGRQPSLQVFGYPYANKVGDCIARQIEIKD